MESKLKSLFHDPEYYVKSFRVSSAYCAKFSVYASWVDDVFSEAVVAKLSATLGEQEELRVLGVGSGSGEMDVKMLSKLIERFPHIHNRVVEPAQAQLDQYKALVQTKAEELQGVNFDWRKQTVDQYEEAGDLMKFHFISAVHSIYYADSAEKSLMYLFNRLEPGGVMLMITVADGSGYWRLWNRFPSFQDNLMHFISSDHIRSYLDRRGIPYIQYRQPSRVDITECFDKASEDGKVVLDFLLHVVKFQETAPEDLQREVMEYIASAACSEKSRNGIFFNSDWDAVVVSKLLDN